MKNTKKINKIFVYILLIALSISNMSLHLWADGETTTLRLEYLKTEGVSNVHFKLYKVGVYENSSFKATGDFVRYNDSLPWNPASASEWQSLGNTLKSYVIRDGINSLKNEYTNSNSVAVFDGLEDGLYFIVGNQIKVGNTAYTSEPFFVVLPHKENGVNQYDVTVRPKGQSKTTGDDYTPPDDNKIKRKVLKVWEGDSEETRPDFVEVELLKNGKVYDTVKLNKENNWRKTWYNLSDRYTWTVVEKEVPEDYTVSIEKLGVTFIIRNIKEEVPPNDLPEDPTPSGKPDPTEDIPKDSVPRAKLPQTGVLWWPIPVLFAAGIMMFIIGFVRREH